MPYFEGTSAPDTFEITLASWTNDENIFLSMYDLGLMPNQYVGSSAWYWVGGNVLYYLNSTNYYESPGTDSSTDRITTAQCFTTAYGFFNFSEINEPPGYYDVYCWNTTVEARPFVGAIMILDVSGTSGSLRAVTFDPDYFVIGNTKHTPTNPLPNTTVTVSFDTTQTADSRIFWRSAPYSNLSNVTGWSTKYDSSAVLTHSLTINNTYVVKDRYYQYWVQSNRSGTVINDTNGGIYYNFSVGGYGGGIITETPSGLENQTAPAAGNALENMAAATGIEFQLLIYAFAFLIIFMATIATLMLFHNMLFAGTVFLTGIGLFTVFGMLPFYFFIIIGLIFAFAMIKLFKGLFD